jgi:murein DD-endopeptidase MepM/ murein hydrolase activator NlpD
MKKKEKNYSIIIVTGATSTNKEFVISSKLIKNSIIALSVLLLVFGFIIFDYLTISFDKEKMKRLETDNTKKDKTISELSANIETIETKLKVMEVYRERISVAMGLTSPNALTEVGTGGPLNNGPISNFSTDLELNGKIPIDSNSKLNPKPTTPSPSPSTENILKKTNDIRQDALKIENTLKFVENVMEEQKVRLASIPSVWPTKGYLTSPYGERIHPFTGRESYHNGQDIATQYGNRIQAPANGIVLIAEYQDYYGNLLVIDHGFGFTTRYGHMASFAVKEGDRVKRFQTIGYVGNTGRSSAPHLHYEVRYLGKPLNPMNFIID